MPEMMVLLGVTRLRLWQLPLCRGSVFECFKAKLCKIRYSALDYNVLKLQVLRLLAKTGPADSSSLAITISRAKDFEVDIHALRMALMRYHKQGLLKRERVGGIFRYALTERGSQRLRWLEDEASKARERSLKQTT
jgi:DNA-binding transcriptional ArsR family regulator